MKFLRDAPLQRKITLVTMFTTLATLLLALLSLSIVELREFRRSFQQELRSIAGLTGGNSVAALEFLDKEAARRTLGVLKEDPRILAAVLYDANGVEFAKYVATNVESQPIRETGKIPSDIGITIDEAIPHQGKIIGRIFITASNRQMLSRLKEFGTVTLLIGFFSVIAAYLLSRQLQDVISRPILRLADTAREVSRSGDYTLRVEEGGNDETGELISQFNQMLGAIDKASRDLLASEKQLRMVTDSLPVLISYIDRESRYQFNNAAYFTWFGIRPEDLKGRPVREILGDEAYGTIRPYHEKAYAGQTVQYESLIAYSSIGQKFISSTLIPDIGDGGEVRGIFALVMDVTDRKEAEAERERLLMSERAARNEAERASRLKDDFLATLSHELRTPLNAIVGWAQILQMKERPPEQVAEGLAVIMRNARVQTKLISDLLDLSRITSGKLSLEMKPVRLDQIIVAALDAVTVSASAKHLHVHWDSQPSVAPVMGDSSRLQQVIWNLLTNSVKFTPSEGNITVHLSQPTSEWVEVRVSDTGQGIPRDFLPYVFERFRQADSSTTRKYGGLGIGLSLVKHLVECHGGSVRVESEGEGLGSTFIVRLPASTTPAEPKGESDTPRPDLRGVKILIIDDEPDALGVTKKILEQSHAIVFTAHDAVLGLEAVKTERPDIVLSDIGMPSHDGYDLIRWIRGLDSDQGGQTPAIALTALARPEDRQKALKSGFQAHLTKPLEDLELITTISRLVSKENDGFVGTVV